MEERVRSNMTYRQLQDYIRKATREANEYIELEPEQSMETKKILEDISTRNKGLLGYGFKGKRKMELFVQARALQDYIDAQENDKDYEDKVLRNYETFINSPRGFNLSLEDYKSLVNIIGTLGSEVLEKLGSEQFDLFYHYVGKVSTLNLTRVIQDVYESIYGKVGSKKNKKGENAGKGISQEMFASILKTKLYETFKDELGNV